MSLAKQQIISDAILAGYILKTGESFIDLVKPDQRHPHRIASGLRIYQDGVAVRLDVELSLALGIQSHAQMRKILGI